MRTIMVMNAKGGCGKSTIATSLASYYANEDLRVALADYDQLTSLRFMASPVGAADCADSVFSSCQPIWHGRTGRCGTP